MSHVQAYRVSSALLALGLSLSLGACGDGGNDKTEQDDDPVGEKVYGFVSLINDDTGTTTYVNLVDSLDVKALDTTKGREFAGYAPTASAEGKVFVASGEAPTVSRYDVSDGSWQNDGVVSFADYLSAGGAANVFISAQKAYSELDVIDRLVWDPSDMSTTKVEKAPKGLELTRDKLKVSRGHDHILRGNRLFQAFYWANDTYDAYSELSQIAVYDTTTDKPTALLDAPCPHLHITTRDPEGNLYFSNGSLSGTSPLVHEGHAKNCFVRIKAGEEKLDDSFTLHFADLTDGREGAGFRYLGDGKGFFAVFHHERIEISETSDPRAVNYSANWRLWTLDLSTQKAAPLEGLEYFSGQYVSFTFEGRTFLLLPAADYASTTVYEIVEGKAVKRFMSAGWIFDMFQVN